jgi:hypothetical protein
VNYFPLVQYILASGQDTTRKAVSMRIKTSVKTGINQYSEVTHKSLISVMGKDLFNKSMTEFKELFNGGTWEYLDYHVYFNGMVIYFEKG